MTPSRRGSSKLLPSPSSFRNFHNPFRSHSPSSSLAVSSGEAVLTPTRSGMFFPRAPRSSTDTAHSRHTRSSSLSAINVLQENQSSPPSSIRSRWRPSVLGHFGMSASQLSVAPTDTLHTRSRPSMSSSHTYTSTTLTTVDGDSPATPPQSPAAESIQARSRSPGNVLKLGDNASSFSVWSGPSPSYLDELSLFSRSSSPRATSTMSCDGYIGMPPRAPLGPKPGSRLATSNHNSDLQPVKHANKPEVAFASDNKSRTLPRVSFASIGPRAKRKKKLVISGIAVGDTRKFDAAKRWCEVRFCLTRCFRACFLT